MFPEIDYSLQISIVVNNAGFLRMGYFDELSIESLIGNIECNALAAIRISHYMYERMASEKKGGLIAFTSSSAWFIPAPYAAMYAGEFSLVGNALFCFFFAGTDFPVCWRMTSCSLLLCLFSLSHSHFTASKAMMTNFATSLSIEARNHNVDVTIVHPSYTHTGLYVDQPKLDVIKFLSKIGWTSEDVADVLFAAAGRVVVRDAGMYTVATNLLGRAIDGGSLARVIMPFRGSFGPAPRSR